MTLRKKIQGKQRTFMPNKNEVGNITLQKNQQTELNRGVFIITKGNKLEMQGKKIDILTGHRSFLYYSFLKIAYRINLLLDEIYYRKTKVILLVRHKTLNILAKTNSIDSKPNCSTITLKKQPWTSAKSTQKVYNTI